MYVRRVRDETLEFGHRGWLLDESFIFYDRKYDSLWVQATGTCIRGNFKGEQLETLPVTHTTWGQWRSLHPETLVLAKPSYFVERYRRDSYAAMYAQRGTKFGLAVFVADRQKFYPLERLEAEPVLHDTLGDRAVLVVFHPPSRTAVAFDPQWQGKQLQLELVEITETDVILHDTANKTRWSGLTGRAQCAEDPRPQLRQLRTSQFVVDNWSRHFPNAPIFGSP